MTPLLLAVFLLPASPRWRRYFAGAIAGGVALASAVASEPARRNFNLPAGDAEATLRQFATQAGGQFVFSVEKVAGVRTREVKGHFTKHEALERMLAGTVLRPVLDAETGALTVDRAGAPEGEGKDRSKRAERSS